MLPTAIMRRWRHHDIIHVTVIACVEKSRNYSLSTRHTIQCTIKDRAAALVTVMILRAKYLKDRAIWECPIVDINPYPTAFPYGNGMVLQFYQQQESSTTKTVQKVINKGLKNLCIVASHWWEFPLTLIPVSSTCFEKLFYPSSGALDCVLQLVV